MSGVWDHRQVNRDTYVIRRDGVEVACVSFSGMPHPSTRIREFVAACAATPETLADLQARCAAWTEDRFPNDSPDRRMAKLLEEAGEFSRAVIGRLEGRAGRGDIGQEAAQVVLVVASTLGRWFPEYDLLTELAREMERVGA